MSEKDERNSDAKMISILIALSESETEWLTLSEIGGRVVLPKNTVSAKLSVLTDNTFVERKGNRYRLGDKFIQIAVNYFRAVEADARTALNDFNRRTGANNG